MTHDTLEFTPAPDDKATLETGTAFTPRFSSDGLVTAIVVDADDGALLMVAHMNAHALSKTLRSGVAHYWSRSRGRLWKKGETSGNVQTVIEMRVDCDQDAIMLAVRTAGDGANCHTGRRSCFYRRLSLSGDGTPTLAAIGDGSD